MPVVKIRTNRQVTIPKAVFDKLELKEGDYVEVVDHGNTVVIKPKKLVDPDDVLTPEEKKDVAEGFEELKQGKGTSWEEVKKRLKLDV